MQERKEPDVRLVGSRETFDVIAKAVDRTVNMVSPTFGPAGNRVIISKVTHAMAVDDGVQIARDLELEDPAENAVMKIVREAAIRTNDRVGDGTTGALIMLQAIVSEIARRPSFDGRKVRLELEAGLKECVTQLKAAARQVRTLDDLRRVARISFDDPDIAELIAKGWHRLGQDGSLTVDRSGTMETELDMAEGITIENGYISPYMVTNPDRMEAVIEKPHFLLTDFRLTEAKDVIEIMNRLAGKGIFNLVVLADNVEQNALATMVLNRMQGKFNCVAVVAPKADRTNVLQDIATLTGAKVFGEKKGDRLEDTEIEDLGRADRFVSRRTESVIVGPRGPRKAIREGVRSLRAAIASERHPGTKKMLERRLGIYTNRVGVLKVGAATENEVQALHYKAEDAVNAVRAAYRGGVVPGAGRALAELKTSSPLLAKALRAPFARLAANCGFPHSVALKKGEVIDATDGRVGRWTQLGVMDPVDVLVAQLESAVSIAVLLATTRGMVVERPQKLKRESDG